MPSHARALIVPLLLAACRGADDHPAEVVGTWAARHHDGIVVDTLALDPDGRGWSSRHLYRLEPRSDAAGMGEPDTILARQIKPSPVVWRVQRNEDGRHLCLVDTVPRDSTCAPLKVVPGTSITVGDVTYQRAK